MKKNYRVDKAFDSLETAVQNTHPLFKDISLMFQSEKQYRLYKERLQSNSAHENITFIDVSNHLTNIYMQYHADLKSIEDMVTEIDSNQTDLKPKFQNEKLRQLLNTNLCNLCTALQHIGCMDTLLLKHNKACDKTKNPILKITPSQLQDELNRNSRCTSTESYVKTAFWLNKFIKYIDKIEDQILLDYNTLNISPETLKTNEKDHLYLVSQKQKQLFSTIFHTSYNKKHEQELLYYYANSYETLLAPVFNNIPDITIGYRLIRVFEQMKSELYSSKDQYINSIIIDRLFDNSRGTHFPSIPNWGISEDSKDPTKYVVSIHLPHYLLPCIFHYPKHSLLHTMEYLNIPSLDLPRFNIEDYFTDFNNNIFPVNVMYSPNQERIAQIKKIAKQHPENKILDYINNHLNKYSYVDKQNPYHIELGE